MISPLASASQASTPSDPPIAAAIFTPAQTAAVSTLVHEATAAAADALRDELCRWHCYLALYLLAQISLVASTIFLIQAIGDPPTRSDVAIHAPCCDRHMAVATPIHSESLVNVPRFAVLQTETTPVSQKKFAGAKPQAWAHKSLESGRFVGEDFGLKGTLGKLARATALVRCVEMRLSFVPERRHEASRQLSEVHTPECIGLGFTEGGVRVASDAPAR